MKKPIYLVDEAHPDQMYVGRTVRGQSSIERINCQCTQHLQTATNAQVRRLRTTIN